MNTPERFARARPPGTEPRRRVDTAPRLVLGALGLLLPLGWAWWEIGLSTLL